MNFAKKNMNIIFLFDKIEKLFANEIFIFFSNLFKKKFLLFEILIFIFDLRKNNHIILFIFFIT